MTAYSPKALPMARTDWGWIVFVCEVLAIVLPLCLRLSRASSLAFREKHLFFPPGIAHALEDA
jgi:hypothetical protein